MGDFRGFPIESLLSPNGTQWDFAAPPIRPNSYHKVLYEFPVDLKTIPKPRHNYKNSFSEADHVKLPYIEKGGASPGSKLHWELIQEALLQPIRNSRQLEAVIRSYLGLGPKFSALHHLFDYSFTEEEGEEFFRNILPEIIQLALNLPSILPGNLPYLKSGVNRSISLSQHQIGSLLANAFLCTFNHREKNYKDNNNQAIRIPGINFDRLFSEQSKSHVVEKIKCLVHYFKKIVTEAPLGVVTFERKHIARNQLPRCDAGYDSIKLQKMHISSQGTIEDNGHGFLQVDFANKFIGGGVLGYGCVQEEIRFVICPELIISRLFTEELKDNEALLMIGAERYSKYTGYGDTFKWAGGFVDRTPHDALSGRRKTSITAIDAVPFHNGRDQFKSGWMRREFHKAYVGFYQYQEHSALGKLAPVATGNWGCGAFRGDPHLKWLIQLMATTIAKRDLVYFTFNDTKLMDELWLMYKWISKENISVKHLWRLTCTFISTDLAASNLFTHIQEMHLKSKKQPSVLDAFKNLQQNSFHTKLEKPVYPSLNFEATSSSKSKNKEEFQENKVANIRKPINVDESTEDMDVDETELLVASDMDLTELSTSKRKLLSNKEEETSKLSQYSNDHEQNGCAIKTSTESHHDDVLDIINLLHGDRNDNMSAARTTSTTKSLFEVVDALSSKKSRNLDSTELLSNSDSSSTTTVQNISIDSHKNVKDQLRKSGSSNTKITDYFCRTDRK